MKYSLIYSIFLMLAFYTLCGKNQTNPPLGNIKSSREEPYTKSQLKEADTSKVPILHVRNIKQARNGDILIASWLAVFRYDARLSRQTSGDEVGQGTSFTNLTGKIISPRFASFWDVLEDRKGNLWFASLLSGVYFYNEFYNKGWASQ